MTALEKISYADGEVRLTGWLARPAAAARAAVVVFPTIANVTEATRNRAEMLAEAGYLAFIADFYGQEVESFEASQGLAKALRADPEGYRRRLAAALETLRAHPDAAGLPMAAIGYCMGGGAVLELARAGADLEVVVSFHGTLTTPLPAKAGAVKARILVCHGDADPMVPREHVISFWEEMDAAGANWHFHSYSGVKHGFTDPGSDARGMPAIAYDGSADRQSWAAMMNLFNEVFGS